MTSDRLPRVTQDDVEEIKQFIRSYVGSSGCDGVVIGQSGGIDSAVTTKLAVDALGADHVHTIFMPSNVTPDSDRVSTESMAKSWGTGYEIINIRPSISWRKLSEADFLSLTEATCLQGAGWQYCTAVRRA